MASLSKAQIPIASSCGGEGVCAKCFVQILSGAENISPLTSIENKFDSASLNYRLSCQAQVSGDVLLDTTYW